MPRNSQDPSKDTDQTATGHTPVMVAEVINYLQPKPGESYLDLTSGWGGHAEAVIGLTKRPDLATLVDRDEAAIAALRGKFAGSKVQILLNDFLSTSQQLVRAGKQFDLILVDLGTSSPHLENAERGFSLKKPGPLDMRMDVSQELTAETIVNNWSEKEISKLLRQYGQEPKAAKITHQIVASRPITTTTQLAAIASRAWPGRSKIHPATRTFQALRIAVNDELTQLEQGLPLWVELLTPGGRLVVISFHSLEDRLVKSFFASSSASTYDSQLTLLTKKPLKAGADEIVSNPRARSAKLRAVAKTKTK